MSGVDVLAVLGQAADTCPDRLDWDLQEARAAVAELMEQHKVMRLALIKIGNGATGLRGRDQWMASVARAALAPAKQSTESPEQRKAREAQGANDGR